jgi:hypothetical protein
MSGIPFDEKELRVVRSVESPFGGAEVPVYDFPVSPKNACLAFYKRRPVWQIVTCLGIETTTFTPSLIPDNIARAIALDGALVPGVSNKTGGKDMFGIEWEFIPEAGGSMVRPGKPFIANASELRTKIRWPDIDSWDWEGHKKINVTYLKTDNYVVLMFLNGFFERLISLMDFEGAVTALIDEDQQENVKEFFEKLSDLYIRLFDKLLVNFPEIDGFCFHDDWGAQQETFFSPATAEEMIVPYMKKITDFLHSKGKPCDLHSCGNLLKQVPNIIKAGWDSWTPQLMNDTGKIYDLYGDKLLISVAPEQFDAENTSEDEQRKYARAFAEHFCKPEKPSAINMYASSILTPAYREELYRQSRMRYGGEL